MLQVSQGGWILVILLLLTVYAAYVFFERFLSLRRERLGGDKLMREVEACLRRGRLEPAMEACRIHGGTLGRFVLAGLPRVPYGVAAVDAALKAALLEEEARLSRGLAVLSVTAQVAPLLGLLGTVTGMIRAFNVLAVEGQTTAQLLAGGIGEALFTTAGGLIVAIPALMGYHYLAGRVEDLLTELEQRREELLGALVEVDNAQKAEA
ncbi:MotA/TolQ/ExbB proton channel family protein [Marinithermus hydrothermalis]|uniref:MotA/TolQ/ExbB proton channel n=1 Tax=Marinithermus hydrothermalis (strain DSM 14884 / JCM 11576 / T1) TaxID=869210 RepID=F2NPD5_MARHT|nr:MotA/TolQ/ExbB proton channel family protein [Marinithermus hydrothermalis]AEB12216.1 MotA/TolQ/ExbB proton channel [Marinithermus hydrothermalis DSM 14884]